MFQPKSMHKRALPRWLVLATFVVSLLVSACGDSQPQTGLAGAWVGILDGSEAFIAIASNGSEVMAYVCDGKTVTQWFTGKTGIDNLDLAAGTVDLSTGGARLQARLTTDQASGSVTLSDGQSFNFLAPRAVGDAGLYRSEETRDNQDWVGGWVVLNDGQLRGLRVSSKGTIETQTSLDGSAKLISPELRAY